MQEPGHNDGFYDKAKRELKWLAAGEKKKPHREWVPAVRTSSGVRFGYWKYNK